jgi:hypothetical protein
MPAKGVRLSFVKQPATKLQARLQRAVGEQSVQHVADDWDIPYWVLRDTMRGATDCPRGLYIPAMAKGLGISAEELIAEAYAPAEHAPVG